MKPALPMFNWCSKEIQCNSKSTLRAGCRVWVTFALLMFWFCTLLSFWLAERATCLTALPLFQSSGEQESQLLAGQEKILLQPGVPG